MRDLVRALHPDARRKVWAAIDALRGDPNVGLELRDELAGHWRLAVGRLRIVYTFDARTVTITWLGPRRTIYEDLAERLRTRGP